MARSATATWVVAAGLLIVATLCWWWIVIMAGDIYGPMTGAAAWMMTTRWDWPHMALLFTMWSAMMVGMMVLTSLLRRRRFPVSHQRCEMPPALG